VYTCDPEDGVRFAPAQQIAGPESVLATLR